MKAFCISPIIDPMTLLILFARDLAMLFINTPNKAYGPEFLKREKILDLGEEGNEGRITPSREAAKFLEMFDESHDVIFH